MKIECTIKRPRGSFIKIDDQIYHFKPESDGRHIADVSNPKHIQAFLKVDDAYQIAEVEVTVKKAKAAKIEVAE